MDLSLDPVRIPNSKNKDKRVPVSEYKKTTGHRLLSTKHIKQVKRLKKKKMSPFRWGQGQWGSTELRLFLKSQTFYI